MKPKVFLSHSKKDKVIIEKIANDLRSCGIDVWYDEWEIPPGESIRKKIFEDGIVSCDMFFVYLTKNSIPSYWVQKELDGALIHEIETKNSFLILFVDEDESREDLSIDLKALNIPKLNDENYLIPLGKLISRTWNSYSKNQIKLKEKDNKIEILELEKTNAELQKRILQIEKNSIVDVNKIKESLEKIKYDYNSIEINLLQFMKQLKTNLADGATWHTINSKMMEIFKTNGLTYGDTGHLHDKYRVVDFTGELILKGLLETKTSSDLDQVYFLTKQGIEFLNGLE
ncbi:toll/interleukin-1 receptor domain-containing protein [Cellulophaga baltica]|uniref:toll/interleukin-1 receptor domain-containing protein n=1 Tax=Cellulophaga baltica TaxID=76594 RepID=UPI0021481868|nr:toll/interleukin-1 receptor domain-containing protein [Cellulophaga baltica]MCR1026809.1 toll/interleukin-1 receptor domain-containing protein [Cellulophaga baltica]